MLNQHLKENAGIDGTVDVEVALSLKYPGNI